MNLPEVHNKKPGVPLSLERVGVSGVKMPIGFVYFENKPTLVVPTFSAYINLPANQKGIHASRNYEIITEVLDCLLYTSPSPRDLSTSRMPSSA